MPRVLNIYACGGKIPPGATYCGRANRKLGLPASPYHNPFRMRDEADRSYVCDQFEREVLPKLNVEALRGQDLICYCAPKRCHCDALLKAANR